LNSPKNLVERIASILTLLIRFAACQVDVVLRNPLTFKKKVSLICAANRTR